MQLLFFYEDHCCTSNIHLHDAFSEYDKDIIQKLDDTINMNSNIQIDIDSLATIDLYEMSPIHINLNGMIISINYIEDWRIQYSYHSSDENYCSLSIVKDMRISKFIRLLEEIWQDFDYYVSSIIYGNDGLTTDKVLFAFIYNLMQNNTFINEDVLEETKFSIIENILQ